MRNLPPLLHTLPWLMLLSSCSSPPKPPTVDEATRRPVNSAQGVELQVCRMDLANARLSATEAQRYAELSVATADRAAAAQQTMAALRAAMANTAASATSTTLNATGPNTVYTVRFDFGSSAVRIPVDVAPVLTTQARNAALVMLRGRTDGSTDNLADVRMARARAQAVRDTLVAAGVDPARIRSTHQPTGDTVADNTSATGRALNRRVEIELYRSLPEPLQPQAAQATAQP